MKNLTLIIGGIVLAINLLFGYLLSGFESFNVWFTCVVIVINTLYIWLLRIVPMKDGFVIGLGFLFLFMAVVEYLLGLNSRPVLKDNSILIVAISMAVFQAIILIVSSTLSKK